MELNDKLGNFQSRAYSARGLTDCSVEYVASVIQRVEAEYASFPWDELAGAGYAKTGDYCFIYSYPPVRTLTKLSPDAVHTPGSFGSLTETAGLYIHVPYCSAICSYCYFAKVVDNAAAPLPRSEYPAYLESELEIHKQLLGYAPRIGTVHFGGGTPSILSHGEISRVMAMVTPLLVGQNTEVTLECAPESIIADPSKLRTYAALGINRLNLGVESLDDNVLRRMGRRHDSSAALQALDLMFDAGFTNINVDLIFGLPGQTVESWVRTLHTLEAKGVHSLSTYRLRKHPRKRISALPTTAYPLYEDGLKMQLAHGIVMDDAGFIRSSSHKYARDPSKLQLQVEEKRGVSRSQLLALGCGAYGFINDTFFWNTKSLRDYKDRIDAGSLPIWMGQTLDRSELMRKSVVTSMHTNRGLSIGDFLDRFYVDPLAEFRVEIESAQAAGLLEVVDGHIRPTKQGRFFSDELSVHFYSLAVKKSLHDLGKKYGMFFEDDKYV